MQWPDYLYSLEVLALRAWGRAMLGAFFDDSGTHDGSPVVAMGGLLGTDEQWRTFEERWLALIKARYPASHH